MLVTGFGPNTDKLIPPCILLASGPRICQDCEHELQALLADFDPRFQEAKLVAFAGVFSCEHVDM